MDFFDSSENFYFFIGYIVVHYLYIKNDDFYYFICQPHCLVRLFWFGVVTYLVFIFFFHIFLIHVHKL